MRTTAVSATAETILRTIAAYLCAGGGGPTAACPDLGWTDAEAVGLGVGVGRRPDRPRPERTGDGEGFGGGGGKTENLGSCRGGETTMPTTSSVANWANGRTRA